MMQSRSGILVLLLCLVGSCAVFLPPIPTKADYPLIDPIDYPNNEAAQKAWRPMSGTAPVSMVDVLEAKALRMPCSFKGTKIERASWDRSVDLDLTTCQGIQFKLLCDNPSPVSGFTLYMQSGNGWYSQRFSVEDVGEWNTVKIEKSKTGVEGAPAGWGKIKTLRLSAWRGKNADTQFYIADLGLLGADAPIVIVRGESAAKTRPSEAKSVATFAQNVAQSLTDLGLAHALMSDLDVTAERLKGKKIVILPHNPGMPDNVVAELLNYLQGGGKLISFYGLPKKLRDAVHIPNGKHIKQTYPGYFCTMRFNDKVLTGAPSVVGQRSWNISESKAVKGKSKVAAVWYDDKGKSTGHAAVVVSDNCIAMTHVMLTDDTGNKRNMLLAMVGHFAPELWKKCALLAIENIGRFGPYKTFLDAEGDIDWMSWGDPHTQNKVDEAGKLRTRASGLCSSGKYAEAIRVATQARELLIDAYCSAQKPQKREHRAWWCHSAFGVDGMTWDEAIKNLADNGFTAILPNMLWGGTAYYKSDVLPVHDSVKEKGDQIDLCVKACKKHGVECHVWKVNWNMSGHATKEFVEKMKKAGRTQVLYDGTEKERWLCPSHPANQKLEIDSMVEVAKKYDVDGIHFDYIRYPGPTACFCKGCRERFEKGLGKKVAHWPEDCREDEAVKQKWLDFRRSNITKVVAAVSEQARKVKPKIEISAAVFRNWPVDRDSVGQDWKLWCEKGYLDFVCPMDYTPHNAQFENFVKLQKDWTGKVPCYPGIGLSCWKPSNDICKLIDQIKITRRLRTGGFTIFNYHVTEANEIVPLCGKGITKKK